MPLDVCHPDTPHKKLRIPEWYISGLMMDRALDAIVRRAKTIDRKHDIPYLAGYSRNGKIIYIDRHMPQTMRYAGRDIETDRYLILHEEVEKTLIDQLGLHYLHAHQIALPITVAVLLVGLNLMRSLRDDPAARERLGRNQDRSVVEQVQRLRRCGRHRAA